MEFLPPFLPHFKIKQKQAGEIEKQREKKNAKGRKKRRAGGKSNKEREEKRVNKDKGSQNSIIIQILSKRVQAVVFPLLNQP